MSAAVATNSAKSNAGIEPATVPSGQRSTAELIRPRQAAALPVILLLTLSACNTTGAGCLTYGAHRSSVPPSPEFAVLDSAMTEACRP